MMIFTRLFPWQRLNYCDTNKHSAVYYRKGEFMTLNEWADTCLSVYKPNQKQGTKYHYTYRNRMKNCILSHIGEMNIEDIKPIDCQMCINFQVGNSAYQINQTKQMMNFLFERAIDNNIIGSNPARNIVKPRGTVAERRPLTNEEREAFLNAIEDPKYLPFAFMYYCGLRPSEARNIRQDDITVVAGVPALHVRGTKSKNADRDIPLPSNLSRLIQKSLKSPNRASQGYLCKLCADTFGKRWRQLKEEIHGGDDLVPYCLRHTYCTDLQHKNVDIRVAQKLMGHSTIDLTSTIYSHLDEDLFTITYEMLEEPHWKCGKAKAPRVRVPCPLPE